MKYIIVETSRGPLLYRVENGKKTLVSRDEFRANASAAAVRRLNKLIAQPSLPLEPGKKRTKKRTVAKRAAKAIVEVAAEIETEARSATKEAARLRKAAKKTRRAASDVSRLSKMPLDGWA